MIYKIKMMSGEGILIESDEDLKSFLREANEGKKLIVTKQGIVNVASIDSIVPHKEKLEEVNDLIRYGKSKEEAERQAIGTYSPFANLLGNNNKQLK